MLRMFFSPFIDRFRFLSRPRLAVSPSTTASSTLPTPSAFFQDDFCRLHSCLGCHLVVLARAAWDPTTASGGLMRSATRSPSTRRLASQRWVRHIDSLLSSSQYGSDPALRFPPYTESKVKWLIRLARLELPNVKVPFLVLLLAAIIAGAYFAGAKFGY